jgi:hypothetical protein
MILMNVKEIISFSLKEENRGNTNEKRTFTFASVQQLLGQVVPSESAFT